MADLSLIPETKQMPMSQERIKEITDTLAVDGAMVIPAPNGALRYDTGKVRHSDVMRYIDPWFLEEIGNAFVYGARKYGPDNWRKGMNWSRCINSCMRHLWAWWREGPVDQESGIHHLALATCSIMFLFVYEREGLGKDDRT